MKKKTLKKFGIAAFGSLAILTSCTTPAGQDGHDSQDGVTKEKQNKLSIEFEKYTLENGLEVVLHEDKSDPVVAVSILVHVGSNRETVGRTGFAHFFEHMLFQKSENLPQGAFFSKIDALGGDFNGGTWHDGTIYYEVVPKDALEKILWMESDRMGYFINAVDINSLEGEKPVVKNEKRQRVDNRAYGHTEHVIVKNLYPEGHPYSWTVIGDLDDLTNATLEDVKNFYDNWYGPNNATLVIAGDFKKEDTKKWVEKYFGEIKKKEVAPDPTAQPVQLTETKSLYHEDNFAQLPEIKLTFPTVEEYHKDAYALDILGQLLTDGKNAPLYKVLVEEQKLAGSPYAYQGSKEIAGTFTIVAQAFEGIDLDTVKQAIHQALDRFEENGIADSELKRIKAKLETDFYNGISGILNKAFQLSAYNEYAGDPGFITQDIENTKAVTKEDVLSVFKKYVKGKPCILTSFVPKGAIDLAVEGAQKANIVEEAITEHVEREKSEEVNEVVKTASSFDRSIEPELGDKAVFKMPEIWTSETVNGIKVQGITHNELPMIQFDLEIVGGMANESFDKPGVGNLVAKLMNEGTANKTPEELENALKDLGADLRFYFTRDGVSASGTCLSRNFEPLVSLLEEMIVHPRWDSDEFDRIKKDLLNQFTQQETNANYLGSTAYKKAKYGDEHKFGLPSSGTIESVTNISIDDLKAYYDKFINPAVTEMNVAGNITKEQLKTALASLETSWTKKEITSEQVGTLSSASAKTLYFIDLPDAKQSVIHVSRVVESNYSANYLPLQIANYKLGSGTAGQLFQVLREEKGYTYGAYSRIDYDKSSVGFDASASVRSNVTLESVETFIELIGNYSSTYTAEQLEETKNVKVRENASKFETLGKLLSLMGRISTFDLPLDIIEQEQAKMSAFTFDEIKSKIDSEIDINKMNIIIVGDAATQLGRLDVLKESGWNILSVDKNLKQVEL